MSEQLPQPTAAVLIIGDEILSGRTQDINLNYIAKKLSDAGIRLVEARTVPDDESEIVAALNALRSRYSYVFTTGGIGPTHDDITADSIGKAFGLPVAVDPAAKARLLAYYGEDKLTPARLRMARLPQGASLIDNPVSIAPGFRVENVFVMAGVPQIMQAMLDGIIGGLTKGPAFHSGSVSGYVAESIVAQELTAIAAAYPQLAIGSYPWTRDNRFGTALVARGTDRAAIKAAVAALTALVAKYDPAPVVEFIPAVM